MKTTASNRADKVSQVSTLVILFVFPSVINFESHWKERVLRAAAIKGAKVHVVLPRSSEALQEKIPSSITLHYIPFRRGMFSFRTDPLTVICLTYLMLRLRPALVHAITIKPVIYTGILTRLCNIKARVFSITGLGFAFIAGSPFRRVVGGMARLGYRLAIGGKRVRVTFENPDDEAVFLDQGIVNSSISRVYIGGGLNTNDFPCGDEPETACPKIVLAGRMLKDKGVFEFVEAARRIAKKNVKAEFILVGDADDLNPATISRQKLQEWHAEGIVRWLGWRDDMVDILREANIVCLPSYREGAPRVLMEAMACGRACVATDVPGCRHVVAHGKTGLLVPPRDADALATALEKLIKNVPLRKTMGQNGRHAAVEEFSQVGAIDFMLSIYREIMPPHEQSRFGGVSQDNQLVLQDHP